MRKRGEDNFLRFSCYFKHNSAFLIEKHYKNVVGKIPQKPINNSKFGYRTLTIAPLEPLFPDMCIGYKNHYFVSLWISKAVKYRKQETGTRTK